ncbi:MAG TPA: hypothetical protein VGR90_02760 [Acidimicrobiales bacterium]|nr:hypothetical protein [Acidimicrobiales bacterium]
MLVWWDYLLAALTMVIIVVLAWVLFAPPPDEEWLPEELRPEVREEPGPQAQPPTSSEASTAAEGWRSLDIARDSI